MKQFEISIMGQFHINHNEDSCVMVELGEDKLLCAVMDGCSMGHESHFASTLITKLLRKIGKEINYRAFVEKTHKKSGEYVRDVMQQLFAGLGQIARQLHLERAEILSTVILAVLDKQEKEVELIVVGDGLVCCNNDFFEYEQDNKPDYLGYHIAEDFDAWYQNHPQKRSLKNVRDFSIATDGIFTFKNFDGKNYAPVTEHALLNYLLIDEQWSDQDNMLGKKLLEIEQLYGLKPGDDLTIIRIRLD